jgi:hypothetical protein
MKIKAKPIENYQVNYPMIYLDDHCLLCDRADHTTKEHLDSIELDCTIESMMKVGIS